MKIDKCNCQQHLGFKIYIRVFYLNSGKWNVKVSLWIMCLICSSVCTPYSSYNICEIWLYEMWIVFILFLWSYAVRKIDDFNKPLCNRITTFILK